MRVGTVVLAAGLAATPICPRSALEPLVLSPLVLALLVVGARADLVTWHYTATVIVVGPAAPVAPGQLLEGTIVLEAGTVDEDPDPDWGYYAGALVSLTLHAPAAGYAEALPPLLPGTSVVIVDRLVDRLDLRVASASSTFHLLIDAVSPLATDTFPRRPPPFAPVDSNQLLRQAVGVGDDFFAARIDSIAVPEPGSSLAGAAALLCLVAWRRRRCG
jgi:hypothetical protein